MKLLISLILMFSMSYGSGLIQAGSGTIGGGSSCVNLPLPQAYSGSTSFAISITSNVDSGNPIYAYSSYGIQGGAWIKVCRGQENSNYTGYFTWITVGI